MRGPAGGPFKPAVGLSGDWWPTSARSWRMWERLTAGCIIIRLLRVPHVPSRFWTDVG